MKQEPPAAYPGGLRLDQIEDELGRNGRIDGAPAALQDFVAGARGEGMRRRDDEATRRDELLWSKGSRELRRRLRAQPAGAAREEKRRDPEASDQAASR
jgi:hypothetical protein